MIFGFPQNTPHDEIIKRSKAFLLRLSPAIQALCLEPFAPRKYGHI